MNIGVIGCGYVGLSNAAVLSYKENVYLWDINQEKLEQIENGTAPFKDMKLDTILKERQEHLHICHSEQEVIERSDLIIVALPTDYDAAMGGLNTIILEKVINSVKQMERAKVCQILIRSTVPIGFTDRMKITYDCESIYFMPEFLREGNAFLDEMCPERIIIGGEPLGANAIVGLFLSAIELYGVDAPSVLYVVAAEAEAIKLFSNAYLAMRVSFFNELDTFAEKNSMDASAIINGICGDSRIGSLYNCPSFGYGGYCLPKDTMQLSNALMPDNILIESVIKANEQRKAYIVNRISRLDGVIGIYRLQAKRDSDNIRDSVALEIAECLVKNGRSIYVYEPFVNGCNLDKCLHFVETVEELNDKCDWIIANRITSELAPYTGKVYTRDIAMVSQFQISEGAYEQ